MVIGAEAGVAQSVEHVIRNDGVGGSSPFAGTISFVLFIRIFELRKMKQTYMDPFASTRSPTRAFKMLSWFSNAN